MNGNPGKSVLVWATLAVLLMSGNAWAIWERVDTYWNNWINSVDFINSDLGWVVGSFTSEAMKTVDGGQTWQFIPTGIDNSYSLTDVAFWDENIGAIAAYAGGVWFTTDGGESWTNVSMDSTAHINEVQWLSAETAVAVGWCDLNLDSPAYVMVTDDCWETVSYHTFVGEEDGPSINFMDVHMIDRMNGYASGNEFMRSLIGDPPEEGWAMHGVVFKTTDGWETCDRVLLTDFAICANKIFFTSLSTGFAACNEGQIWRTQDGGENWGLYDLGLMEFLEDITFISENTGWVVGSGGLNYVTHDGGETWGPQVSVTYNWNRAIDMISNDEGWIGGMDGIMFHTTDAGGAVNYRPEYFELIAPIDSTNLYQEPVTFDWEDAYDPDGDPITYWFRIWDRFNMIYDQTFEDIPESQITFDLSNISLPTDLPAVEFYWGVIAFDGTGNYRVCRFFNNFFLYHSTSSVEQSELPGEFELDAPWPNPFNPSTSIHYTIPRHSDVRVQVFDIMGRAVCSLSPGRQAPGRYQIVWDGHSDTGKPLASGVYILHFQAVGEDNAPFTATRKLHLLK